MIKSVTLLFIGGTEIVFILLIVVLVFGADKLPEIARGMGKGMRTLKDATNDIKHEVTKSAKENNLRFFTNKCTHLLKTSNFGPQGPQNAALQQRYSPC